MDQGNDAVVVVFSSLLVQAPERGHLRGERATAGKLDGRPGVDKLAAGVTGMD